MAEDFMKSPCKHCPFRRDVTPFLHPDRATEIAYSAQNPYSEFYCHKTTEFDDDDDEGDMLVTDNTKVCAGFLTLRAQEGLRIPKGFTPDWEKCYGDTWEMTEAYGEEWNKKHKN